MIVIYTPDGQRVECPDAIRYKTDEHNNLEIFSGKPHDPVGLACFNEAHWERVVVEDDEEETQ